MKLGKWKSKDTGKIVEVVSATEDAVWYVIPEWNGPQNCARDVFESSMEPVEAENLSPSNAIAMAPPPQRLPSTKDVPGG